MIGLGDIERAGERIAPHVHRTPTWRSHTLSERFGTTVSLKMELFQKTGSFKPRGSFNQLLGLSDEERRRGVVGISGGNFAQGMAYAAATLGVDCVMVMPQGSPENSVAATQGYGATVEVAPDMASAFSLYDDLASGELTAVHPFDNPAMQAGNGTLGLEIVEDVPEITDVFISVGGGGFITGVGTALRASLPNVRVWSVETGGADVLASSLAAGRPVEMTPTSLAKTLGSPYLAEAAFRFATEHVHRHTVVTDREAYVAQRFLMERTKVVPELAASCTLAALETNAAELRNAGHVVLVLCGGNVSAAELARYREQFDSA